LLGWLGGVKGRKGETVCALRRGKGIALLLSRAADGREERNKQNTGSKKKVRRKGGEVARREETKGKVGLFKKGMLRERQS